MEWPYDIQFLFDVMPCAVTSIEMIFALVHEGDGSLRFFDKGEDTKGRETLRGVRPGIGVDSCSGVRFNAVDNCFF